jgi:hypothetical protein
MPDTLRVDVCYRPLRIAWAIKRDLHEYRRAVRLSHTLWGGRFNPIVIVDHEEEARRLIDLFRIDVILAVGEPEQVRPFTAQFPYLRTPFLLDRLVTDDGNGRGRAQILDVHNALQQLRSSREDLSAVIEQGMWTYRWQDDDPLADVFLQQLGAFPGADLGIDYERLVKHVLLPTEQRLDPTAAIPSDLLEHPSIPFLSRYGIERDYRVAAGWDNPGFFVGDASTIEDLVCCWNLRAADIALWFIDPKRLGRYESIIPSWHAKVQQGLAGRHEFDRHVGVWSRDENLEDAVRAVRELPVKVCPVSIHSWNGLNVRPPTMYLDEVSSLGVVGEDHGSTKVSFALNEKPFNDDVWFHTQHLVASLSFLGGLYGDEDHTLQPPFIPQLNEFYARSMHFHFDRVRSEPGGIGLIIGATDKDAFLKALPIARLAEEIFGLAGFEAKASSAGLMVRQLIARLGGLQGARVFKIPGVRRLLKTHGPNATLTRKGALHLIGTKDVSDESSFDDHRRLYIEARPSGSDLDVRSVFAYLVDKGLYRIGAELTCPSCRLPNWLGLDVLRERVTCELCGHEFRATRQLVGAELCYRRSGVFGVEKNAQGAVPVALTLQQLDTSLGGFFCTSLDLSPKPDTSGPTCEVDLVWLIPRTYPQRSVVIIGECKDQGSIGDNIENLGRVAKAMEGERLEVFVLLAKLSPFTPEEIERAKQLNDRYARRAILLTTKQLEPYDIYEHIRDQPGVDRYDRRPETLAAMTAHLYFRGDSIGSATVTDDDPIRG